MKDRNSPCVYYECKGKCSKGRVAEQNGICQKCSKYKPRKGFKDVGRIKRKKEKEKYYE